MGERLRTNSRTNLPMSAKSFSSCNSHAIVGFRSFALSATVVLRSYLNKMRHH